MTYFHPDWVEGQRQRWMRPDAHRFIRPDWRRWVKPGQEHDHPFALIERKAGLERTRVPERNVRQMSREEEARRREILRVRWELAALRFEVAMLRHYAALRKANFNPNQPRVPAGVPEGGQWTRVGERVGASDRDGRVDRVGLIRDADPRMQPADVLISPLPADVNATLTDPQRLLAAMIEPQSSHVGLGIAGPISGRIARFTNGFSVTGGTFGIVAPDHNTGIIQGVTISVPDHVTAIIVVTHEGHISITFSRYRA